MRFTLSIKLDNAEVEDKGIDVALPGYLFNVAQRCASGQADTGIVFDINGNRIGRYRTTDGPEIPDGIIKVKGGLLTCEELPYDPNP